MKILHIGKKGNIEKYTPQGALKDNMEMVDVVMSTPASEILELAGDARYIIADAMGTVSGELISGMPELKMIHSEGVGYNFFDTETARKNGVHVCNCNGVNSSAVAEQTILLMLGVLRDVCGGDRAVREANQIVTKENYMINGNLFELADFRIGLVGLGNIGREVARMLKAFGAEVFYYSTHRKDEKLEAELGVTYLEYENLLETCNMISLHVPVNSQTENMADEEFFDTLQDGTYFFNTSRGELVDSQALVDAIAKGKVAGAGLDTVAGEPVSEDNILINQPPEIAAKLLFSPHIGGITLSSFKRAYKMIWKAIDDMEKGKKPANIVNP